MWCEWCSNISYSVQTTIRLTKDGHEIAIEYCGNCMRRTETEYFNGPTTHIHVDTAKRPTKRP